MALGLATHGRQQPRPALRTRERRVVARRGFSLVELVMVLALAAVVAAVAVPRFSASAARYRAESAARRVAADLVSTRERARAMSTSLEASFTVGSSVYTLQGVKTARGGSGSVDLSREPYKATVRRASFGGGGSVRFDAYGVPTAGGDLVVSADGEVACRVVVVAGSGEVRAGQLFRLKKGQTPAAASAAELSGEK